MIKQGYKIIDRFMSSVGLYEKVFGKLLDPLVRDTRRERAKNMLRYIWGFDDIDLLFPPSLDKDELRRQSSIMFQHMGDLDSKK